MDRSALYEEDFHAWSQHQARVLRDLGRAGLRLPNDLDLEHVAEEIEDLGNEQRFQVESNLTQALVHLIKLVALPGNPAASHRRTEILAFPGTASDRFRPSMQRAIDMAALWSKARRRAAKALDVEGHAAPPLPVDCPLGLDELLDPEADPRALAARLAAALTAPDRPAGG